MKDKVCIGGIVVSRAAFHFLKDSGENKNGTSLATIINELLYWSALAIVWLIKSSMCGLFLKSQNHVSLFIIQKHNFLYCQILYLKYTLTQMLNVKWYKKCISSSLPTLKSYSKCIQQIYIDYFPCVQGFCSIL